MKLLSCALLTFLFCIDLQANSNFVGNPYLPYPPGCAQTPGDDAKTWLESRAVRFYQEEISLLDAQTGAKVPVVLALYRSRCSEPNRSLIWLEFTLQITPANREVEISLPAVSVVKADSIYYPMLLTAEPGGWQSGSGVDSGGAQSYMVMLPQGRQNAYLDGVVSATGTRSWLFVLDNVGPFGVWGKYYPQMTAEEYNGAFKLQLRQDLPLIEVPATATLLPEPEPFIPLSGRLSGIWVTEGAADQGFSLAISEFIPVTETDLVNREKPELVLFLAHFTFDSQGDPIWLVGNARFRPGTSEVSIPIQIVTGGEFRGSNPADRVNIGYVTIRANSCNDLDFEFDYSELGLGNGIRRLQRPFSLETAGFECRDYAARVSANQ